MAQMKALRQMLTLSSLGLSELNSGWNTSAERLITPILHGCVCETLLLCSVISADQHNLCASCDVINSNAHKAKEAVCFP